MNKSISRTRLFFIFLATVLTLPFIVNPQGIEATTLLGNIKNAVILIGGSVAIIGWVVAGILYLTSAGGERMATAKKALIAAVIGTVLVTLAQSAFVIINSLLIRGL